MLKISKAFNLIELLTTVAILSIIVAIATPAYKKYIYKTKISRAISLWEECKVVATRDYFKKGIFDLNYLDCFGGIPEGNSGKILLAKNFSDVTDHKVKYFSEQSSGVGYKTSTNEPKFYSVIELPGVPRKDNSLGNDKGEVYFSMSVVNQEIYYCCGTWNNGPSNVEEKMLPKSCSSVVSSNECFNK